MVANWPNIFQTEMSTSDKQHDDERKHKRRVSKGGCSKCSSRQQQQSQLARSPLGLGVVVATSLYCGVKAGIQVCQTGREWPGLGLKAGFSSADVSFCQNVVCVLLCQPCHAWLTAELGASGCYYVLTCFNTVFKAAAALACNVSCQAQNSSTTASYRDAVWQQLTDHSADVIRFYVSSGHAKDRCIKLALAKVCRHCPAVGSYTPCAASCAGLPAPEAPQPASLSEACSSRWDSCNP